jgi:hypothetical protein
VPRARRDSGRTGCRPLTGWATGDRPCLAGRVDRSARLAEREAELLERELGPVREAHGQAKAELHDAGATREAFELNMTIPLFGMGQKTKVFRAWFMEMGKFVPVLLLGDRSNFLWDAAWDFMDTDLPAQRVPDGSPADRCRAGAALD